VHASVGKVSFDADKLNENVAEVLGTLMRLKPASAKGNYMESICLNSTMGPGIKVDQKSALA
jgi:large subunit ribosomal protein L1